MSKFFKEVIITVCIALAVFIGLQVLLQPFVVNQTSMMPTLVEGERIFVNKMSYRVGSPQRGDIVIFRPPDSPESTPLIKRVIGLPGETIQVKSGKVLVNNEQLDEPYIVTPPTYTMPALKVPEGQYFVLGDNRNNSRDSHEGWTVPADNLIGKAWLSVWPPGKWGLAPNYTYAEN